ncbi:hypothetical protein PIB30_084413, partial [Stylosanthes scabra]|nr:hypothetical protein [Stylosanthes scabra]
MLVREIPRKRFLLHLTYLWRSMRKKDYLRYIEELRRRPDLLPLRSKQTSISNSPRSQLIDSLPVIMLRVMISLEFGNRHCRVVVDDERWRIGGWDRWVSMITMIVGAWMLDGAKEIA